jgi:hypothetical protein
VVRACAEATGCPGCGVLATGNGRRKVTAADAPCFGMSVLIIWLKRVWRCAEPDCSTGTWSEMHELIAPRAVLTSRRSRGRPTHCGEPVQITLRQRQLIDLAALSTPDASPRSSDRIPTGCDATDLR